MLSVDGAGLDSPVDGFVSEAGLVSDPVVDVSVLGSEAAGGLDSDDELLELLELLRESVL